MQVQNSTSKHIEFTQTPVPLSLQSQKYISTLSRAEESCSSKSKQSFFPWLFQKVGDFFRWLFCCSTNSEKFVKTVLATLKDGSELIEYKFGSGEERIKIKSSASSAWILLNQSSDIYYWTVDNIKHIIQDLEKEKFFVKVDSPLAAKTLQQIGFSISNDQPTELNTKAEGNIIDFSSTMKLNYGERTKKFINSIDCSVETAKGQDLKNINLIGQIVQNLTGDEKLDINDPQAIEIAWNEGKKKGLKNYKISLDHLLALHTRFEFLDEELQSKKHWPKVMEFDTTLEKQ